MVRGAGIPWWSWPVLAVCVGGVDLAVVQFTPHGNPETSERVIAPPDAAPQHPASAPVPPVALPAPHEKAATLPAFPPEVQAAYAKLSAARRDCDREAYFNGFAEHMDCFYNNTGKMESVRKIMERARRSCKRDSWQSGTLVPIAPPAGHPDDRAFLDCVTGKRKSKKVVVMRRVGSAWLVVGEADEGSNNCYAGRGFNPDWSQCDAPRRP